ncbi:extracellular solute-binding protein [Synechococcus sp. PCC 7336]|uniref:extracellular solute-binding protein n=1 Tax=Synechococcus sp. PCC 7336 TaxID=195250 RepID=UPI0003486B62|nr:extracellular solute-binding protein [Synechococcus sp. PCC 7336]
MDRPTLSFKDQSRGYSRRQLLQLLALGMAGTGLSSCGARSPAILQFVTLDNTVPGSIWREFGRGRAAKLRPVPVASRQALFDGLQPIDPPGWGLQALLRRLFPPAPVQTISLLGADWLDWAIARELILPLDPEGLGQRFATQLPPLWQQAPVRQGRVWGLPWSWGVTAIAYNRERVQEPIVDWADLWRPSLKGKLVLPDHPRDAIGLTLKSLGYSVNQPLAEVPELGDRLAALNAQALTYSSEFYLQTLLLRDAWAVVGWTSDLHQLQKLDSRFEIVIPASGTALWWDLWVVRRSSGGEGDRAGQLPELLALAADWFDFLLQEEVAERLVAVGQTPLSAPFELDSLSEALRARPLFAADVLDRSELLNPLTEIEAVAYLRAWEQMRSAL